MKKIKFGNTNTMVAEMCLGCLGFGTKNDKKDSYEILDYYVEQGGNFLDTSNNYAFWHEGGNGGESESLLGMWMKERKNREKIILATKTGAFPTDKEKLKANSDTSEGWLKYSEGLSQKAIFKAIDDSLKRLQTDYIDVYYAHIDDRLCSQEETLSAFDTLVKQGKVRHIACSNYKTWRLERARNISIQKGWAVYQAVQLFHTYLKPKYGVNFSIQEFVTEEYLDYIRSNNEISLLGYTPLLWGGYTIKPKRDEIPKWNYFKTRENEERLQALKKIAIDTGHTINQVIYAWMMQGTPRVIPLVAVSKMEHLKEDLDAVNLNLSENMMNYLNGAGL